MPEPNHAEETKAVTEQRWAVYNSKMAALFTERDKYPVDSPQREAVAKAILALYVAEGD